MWRWTYEPALKVVLHYAIFRATCLVILLWHKLHAYEKLHGVTHPAITKSRNILLQQALHEVESCSTFLQRMFD